MDLSMVFDETKCVCGHRFDSHESYGKACEGYRCVCKSFREDLYAPKDNIRAKPWTDEDRDALTQKVIKALHTNVNASVTSTDDYTKCKCTHEKLEHSGLLSNGACQYGYGACECREFEQPMIEIKEAKEGRYEKIGREIGELVDNKNKSYGSAFDKAGEILKVLYPNGIKPEQYVDALAITRILDKLFRIATGNDFGQEDAFQDIAGYGILGTARKRGSLNENNNKAGSEDTRT